MMQHPLGMLPRQIGYALSFVYGFAGLRVSSGVSRQWVLPRGAPFPPTVPVCPVPRFGRYCEAAGTSRRPLMASPPDTACP